MNCNLDNFTCLVQDLFKSRDLTHIAHLKTSSYAEHIALEEYYNEVIDLIDNLVEVYQGYYEFKLNLTIPETKFESPVIFLKELLNKNEKIELETPIQNILDDINSLISKTLYKLNFLK